MSNHAKPEGLIPLRRFAYNVQQLAEHVEL
jgi:hypothetical protein